MSANRKSGTTGRAGKPRARQGARPAAGHVEGLVPGPAPRQTGTAPQLASALFNIPAAQVEEFLAGKPPEAEAQTLVRWQDALIESEIPERASVLDLGCGQGDLLGRLIFTRGARGQGVELDPEAVMCCVLRGIPVFQANLDEGLKGFPNGSFDFVVLEETLQTLHRPAGILREMLRVGRHGIVSFPNFGHWKVRMSLTARGRMPVTEWLPYGWHDSPNIHLFTLDDLLDWAQASAVRLVRGYVLCDGQVRPLREDDNLHAEEALLILEAS